MSAVLRLKRKACAEPVEGLVVALKKSKYDVTSDTDTNEVLFKFAATLKSETESVKDHIQAVLSKERTSKYSKWRDPKNIAVSQKNVHGICEKLKKEYKAANEKKKLDLLNNRRLIFSETVPIEEKEEDSCQNAEVRKLFQLYDIIEENEEIKKQFDETESTITCNDEPLIREKTGDYVFDVYIADVQIDDSFVENTVSVRPCTLTDDDIYSGDSDNSGECFEDEDDSNDENNWRNEYPEDENSHSDSEKDSDYDELEDYDPYYLSGGPALEKLHIDEDDDSLEKVSFDHSRILQELDDDDSCESTE